MPTAYERGFGNNPMCRRSERQGILILGSEERKAASLQSRGFPRLGKRSRSGSKGLMLELLLKYGRYVMSERPPLPPLPPSPQPSSPAVRASMRGNRSSNTGPEILLRSTLTYFGLDWFSVESNNPGSPDVVFESEKVAIFVHGCFWHRCPYCQPHFPLTNEPYWAAKFTRNKARDKRVSEELRQLNWKVVVVWECKLLKNPKRQARRIRSWLLRSKTQ